MWVPQIAFTMNYIIHTPDYKSFTLYEELSGAEGPTLLDARAFNGLLNGDTVKYDDTCTNPFTLIKRAEHPVLSGVLELTSKTLYGMTSRNVPIYLFHPFDRRYPPFRVGCSHKDRTRNKIALVEFESFDQHLPRANLVRIIGDAGDFAAEMAALQHAASPFYKTEAQIRKLMNFVPPEADTDRRQIYDEGWDIINIDPEGCRDIDDIIGLRYLGDDVWSCVIGIADVDHYVRAGTDMDKYAAKTLQTIYDNGCAVKPMLPAELSEGLCSLHSGGNLHHCVAYEFQFCAATSRIVAGQFVKALMRNKTTYTYETVTGATNFPVATLRRIVATLGGDVQDTHDWVATLMKHYNLEAAQKLIEAGHGILRSHTGPKQEKLELYEKALGPTVAQQFASEAAKYVGVGPTIFTHYGMDGRPYCHATSPIRRYADLVNQRILKGALDNPRNHELLYSLNVRSAAARDYDRIQFFLQQLGSNPIVDLVIVDEKRGFVPQWKQIVRYASTETPGTTINARFYYDATQPKWKHKIVFQKV
jgi:exoribonuclease R